MTDDGNLPADPRFVFALYGNVRTKLRGALFNAKRYHSEW